VWWERDRLCEEEDKISVHELNFVWELDNEWILVVGMGEMGRCAVDD